VIWRGDFFAPASPGSAHEQARDQQDEVEPHKAMRPSPIGVFASDTDFLDHARGRGCTLASSSRGFFVQGHEPYRGEPYK